MAMTEPDVGATHPNDGKAITVSGFMLRTLLELAEQIEDQEPREQAVVVACNWLLYSNPPGHGRVQCDTHGLHHGGYCPVCGA